MADNDVMGQVEEPKPYGTRCDEKYWKRKPLDKEVLDMSRGRKQTGPKCLNPELMKRMFDLFAEGKSGRETAKILNVEGFSINLATVQRYKRGGNKVPILIGEEKKAADVMILDSIEKATSEFQDLYETTKRKMKEWEDDPEKTDEFLRSVRLLNEQMLMVLKKLGVMHDSITQKVTINNNFNEFNLYIKDLGAELDDKGRVVIPNPKPELLEIIKKSKG
jgi:hypothetical protein